MGTFKKYHVGADLERIQFETITGQTQTFSTAAKDTSGTSITAYKLSTGSSYVKACFVMLSPYNAIIPVATADDIENYSSTTYTISAVGTTTYSKTIQTIGTNAAQVFAISVANSGNSDITVKCIKFKKTIFRSDSSEREALVCAYYLDENEWITIPPNDTGALTVIMKVGT